MSKSVYINEAELSIVKNSWLSKSCLKDSNKVKSEVILPVKDKKNILVTSELPNVNNAPYHGNIIGSVLSADIFARYCRLRGWNTLFISGTEEYGTGTKINALEEQTSSTPQNIYDQNIKNHKEVYKWFNISFDKFGRTKSSEHTKMVQEIFKQLHDNGYTITTSMEQFFCEKCDRILTDQFFEVTCPSCKYESARGDQCNVCENLISGTELLKPRCKICRQIPVKRYSQNLYFNLPKVKAKLNNWVDKSNKNWSYNVQVITKSMLEDGLMEMCITKNLKCGIPVPLKEFKSKVFDDEFAAPMSYMSITAAYTEQWLKWWQPEKDTKILYYQFVAKNNVISHSIMFPAYLFATEQNYTFASHIIATEYLNYEHGNDAQNTRFPADIIRFYLMFNRTECQSSSFNWNHLAMINNWNLFYNLGNFFNTTLSMLEKFFDSIIPEIHLEKDDLILLALVTRDIKEYLIMLDKANVREGLRLIVSISRRGNKYIKFKKPWTLVHGSNQQKIRAGTIIGLCVNLTCLIAIILQPYMPQTVIKISKQINVDVSSFYLTDFFSILLKPGHKIGKRTPIFNKMQTNNEFKSHINTKIQKIQINSKKRPNNNILKTKIKQESKGDIIVVVPQQGLKQISSIEQMEEAISKQSDLIQLLKQGKTEKREWEPYVNGLLEMKKKLEQMKKTSNNSTSKDDLDKDISIQHPAKIRKIKEEPVDECEASPETNVATTQENINKKPNGLKKLGQMKKTSNNSTSKDNLDKHLSIQHPVKIQKIKEEPVDECEALPETDDATIQENLNKKTNGF